MTLTKRGDAVIGVLICLAVVVALWGALVVGQDWRCERLEGTEQACDR